jgi:predicted metal-binding membrane protein
LAVVKFDNILKRERLATIASLAGIVIISWIYLFRLAGQMASMDGEMGDVMDMPGMDVGLSAGAISDPLVDFLLLAAMWAVMMLGMMLPAAAPTILLFAALERKRSLAPPSSGRTPFFTAGYFVAWFAFSAIAAAAQETLSQIGWLSTMEMATTSSMLGGALFVVAGLYEFSPLKYSCLSHCRSPLEWLPHHYRPGATGALRMGIEHGLYCLGCCWVLMLLLFAVGVMNLLWIAALAAIVLAQKILPGGRHLARFAGAALVVCGVVLMARPLFSP